MKKLEVGMSFDVVEWLEKPFGVVHDKYIGKQCIKCDVTKCILTPHYKGLELVGLGYIKRQVKPIGKLTIKELK